MSDVSTLTTEVTSLATCLHHVALIASDYARSKDFYTRVLGLRVVHEFWRAERQSWKLDLALPDGSQLELFSFPGSPPRPSRPEACGLRHLALVVDDIDAARARLLAEGVDSLEPVRIDEFTAARFCFFADPDGLPIELVEPAPARAG
ncbi:VOC family protein [Ideonella azotifigens]|uniref:VOC family protein n=1 Tax=Ideonella azotifigens TaxID=513160 RepID=A0ABN1KD33_9BURK|nr:VOC family protein [Ideonella azotifigens]MCD2343714.1 VOC family protein [Ideonella azotifigens]